MTLMVGLNMRGVNYRECCLKWGYNQAIGLNGLGLGHCYAPAENTLRKMAGKKEIPPHKCGSKLVWFDLEKPENCIFEKDLKIVLDEKFPGSTMTLNSPRLAAVTPTLKEMFKSQYGIKYDKDKEP
jgi:hypothetical protein